MLFYDNILLTIKHSALVLMISAAVFLAGSVLPDVNAIAEAQKSDATASNMAITRLLNSEQLTELVGSIALYPD